MTEVQVPEEGSIERYYSTESVAESVLAEVLLHSRQRHLAYMDMVGGKEQEARKGINLLNKTAGIIGYGNIGSRVGELLKGVGMNVMAWDPFPRAGLEVHPMKKIFEKAGSLTMLMMDAMYAIHGSNLWQHLTGSSLMD